MDLLRIVDRPWPQPVSSGRAVEERKVVAIELLEGACLLGRYRQRLRVGVVAIGLELRRCRRCRRSGRPCDRESADRTGRSDRRAGRERCTRAQPDLEANEASVPANRARNTFLSNLPTEVLGTSSTNSKRSGIHHLATLPSRCSRRPVGLQLGPLAPDDAGAGALAPALVGHRDHGGLDHVGVGHDRVLQLDRRDPLPSRLDQVLGAVHQLDVTIRARPRRRPRFAASRPR